MSMSGPRYMTSESEPCRLAAGPSMDFIGRRGRWIQHRGKLEGCCSLRSLVAPVGWVGVTALTQRQVGVLLEKCDLAEYVKLELSETGQAQDSGLHS